MEKIGINTTRPDFIVHVWGNNRELIAVHPDNSVVIVSDITLNESLQAIKDLALSLARLVQEKERQIELSCPKCGKTTKLDVAASFVLSWGASWIFHCEYCSTAWKIQLRFKEMKDDKEH